MTRLCEYVLNIRIQEISWSLCPLAFTTMSRQPTTFTQTQSIFTDGTHAFRRILRHSIESLVTC